MLIYSLKYQQDPWFAQKIVSNVIDVERLSRATMT